MTRTALKRATFAIFAAGVALGAAIAGPAQAQTPAPVRSMMEMRTERVVKQAWDLSCGAAVLATLLRYQHGEAVSERDVAIGMMNRPEYLARPEIVRIREGFSLLDMRRFVATRGLVGEGFGNMTLKDLVARAPVVVPIHRNGYNHFVIFRGMARNRVLVADPSFGTRTLRTDQFERLWRPMGDMGRVGFIVRREGQAITAPGALAPTISEFYTFS